MQAESVQSPGPGKKDVKLRRTRDLESLFA
jgi:hypothetical protein